ncbi:hypothetical protein BKA82DRAFT_17841 [Pisolithus tinctorius]|uniref:CCHC-type domain-containing protein n=1 Tax=Pisolithus tinctorius Marx 270 TaxID=870435 RepID=A0A0C3PL57_PISTI|nr:hypothetical protein BKA82DRAFT_17841 [Pisolithus tinctorius]KIO15000.1 hypothetical protein M404DRAFT_17841 [Pisolithus tinctorius Marx 270]
MKDKVCQVGEPCTLHKLHYLTQEIDVCYWECKEEVQQPKTGSNNNDSGSSPKPPSSKLGGNNSNSSKTKPSKLSKYGKLTLEECKHHIEGNLCMFCGGPGHFTEKCPKKAGKAKAHAVATTEAALASGSGSTPETKHRWQLPGLHPIQELY